MPKILVVDDEKPLDGPRFALERGLRLVVASDGPAGLAVARESRPDVVILDVMPWRWTVSRSAAGCAAARRCR